ncbi:MAG: hypothetical protein IJ520_03985, partial [Synergistaceae bacterium]|nr:hypothetical protein [Synergistaceae bacterium]
LNFKILATGETYETLVKAGIKAERVKKIYEGRPNVLDFIINGDIDLIINTPQASQQASQSLNANLEWGGEMRRSALRSRVPIITTIAAARAAVEGIEYMHRHNSTASPMSLQEWHKLIN